MSRYVWLPTVHGGKIRVWPLFEPHWIEALSELHQRAKPGQTYKVVIVEGLGAVSSQQYTDVVQANAAFAGWARRLRCDRLFGVGLAVRDADGGLSTLLVHTSNNGQERKWFMAAFFRQLRRQGEEHRKV